jgi:hypothetical protein
MLYLASDIRNEEMERWKVNVTIDLIRTHTHNEPLLLA